MEASTDGRTQPKLTMVFIEHNLDSSRPEEKIQSMPKTEVTAPSHNDKPPASSGPAVSQNTSSDHSSISLQASDGVYQSKAHAAATTDDLGQATTAVCNDISTPTDSSEGERSSGCDENLSGDVQAGEDTSSTNNHGAPLGLFHLPVELRSMIWKLGLPG